MSPRDRALWLRFQRKASTLSPELSKVLLDAWDVIRSALTDAEIEKMLAGDNALIDRALLPVRAKLSQTVEKGFTATVPDLPKAGKINGTVSVGFNVLNPKTLDAVRRLDSRVINTLTEDVRETVRAFVENGLRDGKNPKQIAKDLRPVIGMSPTQAKNAEKYGQKLTDAGKSPAQVEKAVASYQRKAIATNAYTNARTVTTDSLRLGQRLTWEDAIQKGIVERGTLERTWRTVGDDRVRPEHVAMNGETVPFDNHYSNGDLVPGESSFNCRCVEVVRVNTQAKLQRIAA